MMISEVALELPPIKTKLYICEGRITIEKLNGGCENGRI